MHNPSKLTIGLHSTIYYIAGNLILHGQRSHNGPGVHKKWLLSITE